MVRLDFKLCNVPWLPKLLAGVSKIIVATRIIGKACQNNWTEVARGSTSTLLLYQLWRKKLMPWQFWAWSSIWSHPPLFKRTGRDFPAPMYFHICMTIVGNGALKKNIPSFERKKWPSSKSIFYVLSHLPIKPLGRSVLPQSWNFASKLFGGL